jgi:hypothetical protein
MQITNRKEMDQFLSLASFGNDASLRRDYALSRSRSGRDLPNRQVLHAQKLCAVAMAARKLG